MEGICLFEIANYSILLDGGGGGGNLLLNNRMVCENGHRGSGSNWLDRGEWL